MNRRHWTLLPEEKRGAEGGGREGRIPEVTMVGTELAMELGGATIPEACRGGGGEEDLGGDATHTTGITAVLYTD